MTENGVVDGQCVGLQLPGIHGFAGPSTLAGVADSAQAAARAAFESMYLSVTRYLRFSVAYRSLSA